ncbi:GCN5-related N-acetyltransferase [uncultured Paludibacter sp.]|nr:GCN5-related N-acetyltransferase [uncultured Paludibacter sp.]
MKIDNCTIDDLPLILDLYNDARALQRLKKMVVWPTFEEDFIIREINEKRQWKITEGTKILCNWAVTFNDKEIWENKDKDDGIYIHRICTNPNHRGNCYIDTIVSWAKTYAQQTNRRFIRLDTLGNNTKLIEHYTSSGFIFLGMYLLTNISTLPKHYQDEPNCCLFEIDLENI